MRPPERGAGSSSGPRDPPPGSGQGSDDPSQRLLVDLPFGHLHDATIRVHEVQRRERLDPERGREAPPRVVDRRGGRDAVVREERRRVGPRAVPDRRHDREERDVRESLHHPAEDRELSLAVGTPRRPHGDHRRSPEEVAPRHRAPTDPRRRESGYRLARRERLAPSRTRDRDLTGTGRAYPPPPPSPDRPHPQHGHGDQGDPPKHVAERAPLLLPSPSDRPRLSRCALPLSLRVPGGRHLLPPPPPRLISCRSATVLFAPPPGT